MRDTNDSRFGRLQKVAATCEVGWTSEAEDFTPWLGSNLDLLGQEIGLALRLTETEHPVGRYQLDILAEDAQGRVIVIENQFGQTDHDHLGKLLTYCAGTQAAVVIWIAERLTDEHAAALEWLNEHSVEGVGFFGVELELLRIDESRAAPHFRVVVQPNEWSKQARPTAPDTVEWNWQAYGDYLRLSQDRLAIARRSVELLSDSITRHGLDWEPKFRKGYVPFSRRGGYNVLAVDLMWNKPPRIWVKLPASPEELHLSNPFPDLQAFWVAGEHEWSWTVTSLTSIPDVDEIVELAARFHPQAGPLVRDLADPLA